MPGGWWGGGGGGGGGSGEEHSWNATAAEAILAGSIVYLAGPTDGNVAKADQSNTSKIVAIGVTQTTVAAGGTVKVQQIATVTVRMVGSLTLVNGNRVFLSTDGRGTNVGPSSGASVIVGYVKDASGYAPLSANPQAVVALTVREPIKLA